MVRANLSNRGGKNVWIVYFARVGQHGLSKDLRRFTKQLDNGNVSMIKNRTMVDVMTILNGQMKKKVICKLHERGPYQPLIKQ